MSPIAFYILTSHPLLTIASIILITSTLLFSGQILKLLLKLVTPIRLGFKCLITILVTLMKWSAVIFLTIPSYLMWEFLGFTGVAGVMLAIFSALTIWLTLITKTQES